MMIKLKLFELQVACSHDNQHVVAVTSNNMVCIWRRTEDEGGAQET